MNEGENSSIPNNPNFSSPNIVPNGASASFGTETEPAQQAITSSDISAMAGTNAGAVAAAAAAMPENDAPTTVSSGVISSGSESSASQRSRFNFGSRRFHGSNSQSQQQTSSYFSNAPDYFSQAAGDIQLPSDYDTEGQRKKKIKLIAICGGAIALIVIAIVAFVMANSSSPSNAEEQLENLRELNSKYVKDIELFERSLDGVVYDKLVYTIVPSTFSSVDEYNQEKTTREGSLAKIKEYRNKINDYSNLRYEDKIRDENVSEYISKLKTTLDSRIKVYEEYSAIYTALYTVYIKYGSDESLKSLESSTTQEGIKTVVSKLRDYYSKRKTYIQSGFDNDCNNNPRSQVCIATDKQLTALTESIEKETALDSLIKSISSPVKEDIGGPLIYMNYIDDAMAEYKK